MRKILVTMWITLDGFIAGPNGELDWIQSDDELGAYEMERISAADILLQGRQTYQDFAGYWPHVPDSASDFEKQYAAKINPTNKVVISKSLQDTPWGPAQIYRDIEPEQIHQLKAEGDGDILIYGSASIIQQLANLGLIDEYHLLIHPIVFGAGKPLFEKIEQRANLKLISSETFKSGVVVLKYRG